MKSYLGDAVYAEMSRGMIKLTTNNGEEDTNTIYLEPDVYFALRQFVEEENDHEDERSALEGYPEGM